MCGPALESRLATPPFPRPALVGIVEIHAALFLPSEAFASPFAHESATRPHREGVTSKAVPGWNVDDPFLILTLTTDSCTCFHAP